MGEPTAEELGISPDDIEFTSQELEDMVKQSAQVVKNAKQSGETGIAEIFTGTKRHALKDLAKKMQPKGNPQNN